MLSYNEIFWLRLECEYILKSSKG
uniref:Uncharacterized protein n=1 Tax=Rhizophora mucronata TaxID=61149 RepID=A0A2P2PHB6_RHIMU